MKFELNLTSEAEDDLAEIWLVSRMRQQIAEDLLAAERMIERDGAAAGEPMSEGLFKVLRNTVSLICSVNDKSPQVIDVHQVRYQ